MLDKTRKGWLAVVYVLLAGLALACSSNKPPIISSTFQSAKVVDAGGTVKLMVSGQDPDGTSVSFSWEANEGTLTSPVSTGSQSEVTWTSPLASGSFRITAKVRDASGAEASRDFEVKVTGTRAPQARTPPPQR